jgi:hypothetical protein
MKHTIFGGIFVLLVASVGHGADQKPALSADYEKMRDLILPSPHEQSYRSIDWRTNVLRGVVDAQRQDKPVMIFLMNGHPLGCT